MTTINEQKMSKSLCVNCQHCVSESEGEYGTWCTCYKDVFQAIYEEKIIIEGKSEPTTRSVHYDRYGLVYCEGYTPRPKEKTN